MDQDNRPPRGRARGKAESTSQPSEQGGSVLPVVLPASAVRMEVADETGTAQAIKIHSGYDRLPEFITTRIENFPKIGKSGDPVKLYTNYFPLQTKKTVSFRLYTVEFNPLEENTRKKKALMRTKETEFGPFLFEGTQLFTTHELPPSAMEFEVFFPDKPESHWQVKIEFKRVCGSLEPIVTQLYNVLLKKAQKILELTLLGRFYFDSNATVDIRQHQIKLWPGFITSMRQMEETVLLNVNLTFKVCRINSVLDMMKRIREQFPHDYQQVCERVFVGTVVMTTYNRRTYKVNAIDWTLKPTNTFDCIRKGEKKTSTFVDYYRQKGVEIAALSQPMLVSHPTRDDVRRGDTGDRLLVPEMCYQTGLSDEMRGDFRLMKDISQHLHMPPRERMLKTVEFVNKLVAKAEISNEAEKWGLRFKSEPVAIQGRILPSEEIIFNREAIVKPNDSADWSHAFRNNSFYKSVPLRRWALLYPSKEAQNIDMLISNMRKVAGTLNWPIPDAHKVVVTNPSPTTYQKTLRETVGLYKGQISMIMIILPNNKLELYAACKQVCSMEYGIPSQCFLSKNVVAKGLSICTKLVVQMNAKLGGEPWALKNPLKGLMVVGFDVHHGKGTNSYGAMTATTSVSLASYYSSIVKMQSGVNMCTEIGNAMGKCLKGYRTANNGQLPTRIIFYRDGVGEGQLEYVYKSEIESLQTVFKNLYSQLQQPQPQPKFTLVVVTRRINTRLFLRTGPDVVNVQNPKPGTVVDDKITCPERYDFYLVPQSARQGTVSPVSFNVLVDDSGLDADKMQRFTFKMCHGYFNWSGTVAVPAPCQYAHKLAFLTGTALGGEVNDNLFNYLHYL